MTGRICMWLLLAVWPALVAAEPYGAPRPVTSKTVHTTFGEVRGRVVQLNVPGLGAVEEYLGIPYAAPPLNDRRFMPPTSAAKWPTMTKDATKMPPVCVQMFPNNFLAGESFALKWMPEAQYRFLQRLRTHLRNEQEDCLYLNIYVPERKGNKPLATLPVLVLVHGGSYAYGTGNVYNASILASYGQVIVVTLNYRLGVFGFLSAGYKAPTCNGNWGLGDIAAALEFLRQTIGDFSGDKQQITLMGWDTGASLVNLLMSSPITTPSNSRSFQRAILLGGSALNSWSIVKNPAEIFYYLAETLGCPPFNDKDGAKRRQPVEPNLQETTNCLTSASVENITKAARDIEPPTYLSVFGPTVDGSIVTNDPILNLREHSGLFRGLDLMIGLTKQEAFHLMANDDLTHGVDRQKRDQIYRTLVTNLYQWHRNEIFSAIVDEYTDWRAPHMQPQNVRQTVLNALADGLFVAPIVNVARLHSTPKRSGADMDGGFGRSSSRDSSSSSDSQKNTFMYLFAHETKGFNRGPLTDSVHNEDLPYILGYPLLDAAQLQSTVFNYSYGKVERTLSEAMMRYVSNFVKSGDPNRPVPLRSRFGDEIVRDKFLKIMLPPFDADFRESYTEISENPVNDMFYRAHEVAFWNKFLPSLEKAGETEGTDKHNQFPKKSSYYGIIRPTERYPQFIPPPLPPISMPTTVRQKLQEEKLKQQTQSQTTPTQPPTPSGQPVAPETYSTVLGVTVAVGSAMLILNILVFAGIYHQWGRPCFRKRHYNIQQQIQHHYDMGTESASSAKSPVTGHNSSLSSGQVGVAGGGQGQPSYSLASPLPQPASGGRMPPPPPPPVTSTSGSPPSSGMDNDLHPTLSKSGMGYQTHHMPHYHVQQAQAGSETPATPHSVYAEQEPLLNRSFISPTCPRHGKQAAAAMAAMEEIQV